MHSNMHDGRALRTALTVSLLALVALLWPPAARPSAAVEPADPSVPADAVSWADRSGVRAITEALSIDPRYRGNYLSWTGITIGSLRTERAITPEFVASTGPASKDQLPVAEYVAPVFSNGQPIVAVGIRHAPDGGWGLGPQIYPAAVGRALDGLPNGVTVLYEQTNSVWFALEGDVLRPMGPKSAALLGDGGPIDLTTLRDRLARGPVTTTAPPPAVSEAASSATAEPARGLGLWFWVTLGAVAILAIAILAQLASVRRRRRRRRHHLHRLA